MYINSNTKIPGVTRPGRQLVDGIQGDQRIAKVSTDRLEHIYIEWLENGAPKNLPEPEGDGFTTWAGGSIPVHPRDKVQVKLRGGYTNKEGGYLQGRHSVSIGDTKGTPTMTLSRSRLLRSTRNL